MVFGVAGDYNAKENSCPSSTTTSCNNDTCSSLLSQQQQQQQHKDRHFTSLSDSFQHQPLSIDSSAKRKSPSIFSSVEQLARSSDDSTQPAPCTSSTVIISDHATSTPVTRRHLTPLTFDLSADSGYGDSALRDVTSRRDVTSGVGRTADTVSMATDDVIVTPLKLAHFGPTPITPVSAVAPVLRHRSISVSGLCPIAADVSKTGLDEKLHPEGEIYTLLSVAMETASSPQLGLRQQPQDSQLSLGGHGVRNPQHIPEACSQSTDGKNYVVNEENSELIQSGFGLINPILSRTTGSNDGSSSESQFRSENFGKSS